MITALLCLASIVFAISISAADNVVYISDGGYDGNSGATPDTAVATLERAYTLLSKGGTLVVCGDTTVPASFLAPVCSGEVRYTSNYGGTDYRTTANARLIFSGILYLSSDTAFGDINIHIAVNNSTLVANNNKLLIDDGVSCTKDESVPNFASITAGTYNPATTISDDSKPGDLTVNSGSWRVIRLGNRAKAAADIKGDMKLTVNGGEFFANVAAGSSTNVLGNIDVVINDGVFHAKVSASYNGSEAVGSVDGNVSLTINGGTFYNTIDLCTGDEERVSGMGTLTVNGGNFDLVPTIGGANCAAGSKADLSKYTYTPIFLLKLVDFGDVVNGSTSGAVTEATAVTTEATPADTEGTDAPAEQTTPATEETTPATEKTTPVAAETTSATEETAKATSATTAATAGAASGGTEEDGGSAIAYVIVGLVVLAAVSAAVVVIIIKKKRR